MSGTNHSVIRLQDRIADYAHDLLATHTVREYEYVIGEWQDYINRVVDAEKLALEEHQKVLKDMLNDMQKQQQAGAMLAMLALTLVTGPALSWIGGAIQYRLYPALMSQTRWKTTMVWLRNRQQMRGTAYRMNISESEHNKVAAKIFGDAGANMGQQIGIEGLLGPRTANSVAPRAPGKSYQELTALAMVQPNSSTDDLHRSLKTKMEAALNDEKARTIKTISDLALEVRRNPNFSQAAFTNVVNTYPMIKVEQSGPFLQNAVDKFVERKVDEQRAKWAREWLYYGSLPPKTTVLEMSRKIEREIWALWILDQEFRYVEYDAGIPTGEATAGFVKQSILRGKGGVQFSDRVLERLIELGVVLPQTKRQFEALNSRNANNSHKENPTVLVHGSVDEGGELDEIHTWAKNKQPEMLSGHFDSVVRDIGSIVNVHKVVK